MSGPDPACGAHGLCGSRKSSHRSALNILPGIPGRPTRCCSRASSPMWTHIATGSAPTTGSLLMNRPAHHYHLDGARFDAPPDLMPSTGA